MPKKKLMLPVYIMATRAVSAPGWNAAILLLQSSLHLM
jgi:hypothetical protein